MHWGFAIITSNHFPAFRIGSNIPSGITHMYYKSQLSPPSAFYFPHALYFALVDWGRAGISSALCCFLFALNQASSIDSTNSASRNSHHKHAQYHCFILFLREWTELANSARRIHAALFLSHRSCIIFVILTHCSLCISITLRITTQPRFNHAISWGSSHTTHVRACVTTWEI